MLTAAGVFKHRDGAWPNLIALAYVILGHGLAIALLAVAAWPLRLAAVLLAAHTLVIATYLAHECMHGSIFRHPRWNARLGAGLVWLAGGAPAGYQRLRRKHLHHHIDRNDPLAFDYRAFLANHARVRRTVIACEWLHVPALELLLRLAPLAYAFARAELIAERRRVLAATASRLALAALLLSLGPTVLALYACAYLLFVVGVRFSDAFHHSFELVLVRDHGSSYGAAPGKTRTYEQLNTYSNVISRRWPVLNLLVLNFVFHNAHHARPAVPWHRLPALDARLFGGDRRQEVPMRQLVADFHALRIDRLSADRAVTATSPDAPARFVGAVAVSLLTM
jgi:fatty acid desaturase